MKSYFDWRLLADAHRPTEPTGFYPEIRRLYGEGLTPRDIAAALRIDLGSVLSALKQVRH